MCVGVLYKWSPDSSILQPYKLQPKATAACVVAHQYSSGTFTSLPFYSRNKKSARLKKTSFLPSFKKNK
jgi:hypothetical protein